MSVDTSVGTDWKEVSRLDVDEFRVNHTVGLHAMYANPLLLTRDDPIFIGGTQRIRATEITDDTGHYWRGSLRRYAIRGRTIPDLLGRDAVDGAPFPWRLHYRHETVSGLLLASMAWEYDAVVTRYVWHLIDGKDGLIRETLFWRADGARYSAPFEG